MKAVFTLLFAGLAGLTFASAVRAAEPGKYTDGEFPVGVINVKGILYGTTYGGGGYGCQFDGGCGTVFSLDPGSGVEKVLYSFCNQPKCVDGYLPGAGLIDVKGILYGTTNSGGRSLDACSGYSSGGCGTVFSFDPDSNTEKVIYSFCSQNNCSDGAGPIAGLIDVKGMLYGTAHSGGTAGYGTVFALGTGVLHSFCSQRNCTDGAEPASALLNLKGTLYGTTLVGGSSNCTSNYPPACGTVFGLDAKTEVETVLYSFCSLPNCADGSSPYDSVIDLKGALYGTTGYGGLAGCLANFGCGTVFSVDLQTGSEKVLYSFCSQPNCADGADPISNLINIGGSLYGTTQYGGNAGCDNEGCGTVFSINPDTGALKLLYAFCAQPNCADGALPNSLMKVGSVLYGTTDIGGSSGCNAGYGCGTVFSINPVTGKEKVLYAFCPEGVCAKPRAAGRP